MSTDLDIDPNLADVLRRTLHTVAEQTPAEGSGPLLVRVDPLDARRRTRWVRPVGAALAGAAAAAAVAVGVLASGSAGPTVGVAAQVDPAPPDAGAPAPAGVPGAAASGSAQQFQDLVAGEIRVGFDGVGDSVSTWSDADAPQRMYVALVGSDGGAQLDLVVDLRVFDPGEFQDDPAWAQQIAGTTVAPQDVAEGRLFLDEDGRGASVVAPHGLVRVRLQHDVDPLPTPEALTELARQITAGTADFPAG